MFWIDVSILPVFIGLALLSYISPGPDWAIIGRQRLYGCRQAIFAALGVQSGLLVHMLMAAFGISALLSAFPNALWWLQLVGALYLVYLGCKALISLRQLFRQDLESDEVPRKESAFRQGLLVNVLNPKAAVFFISILPQFIRQY